MKTDPIYELQAAICYWEETHDDPVEGPVRHAVLANATINLVPPLITRLVNAEAERGFDLRQMGRDALEITSLREQFTSMQQHYFKQRKRVWELETALQWIPVTERLPETFIHPHGVESSYSKPVLVSRADGTVQLACFYYVLPGWAYNGGQIYDVVAWRDLPTAYVPTFPTAEAAT